MRLFSMHSEKPGQSWSSSREDEDKNLGFFKYLIPEAIGVGGIAQVK